MHHPRQIARTDADGLQRKPGPEQPDARSVLPRTYQQDRQQPAQVVKLAADSGTPCPAFRNSLTYIDSYRQARLPANLLQAQRDYFGAHTYRRIDKEGVFHTEWDK